MNYVGVDLHKETSWFYIIDENGKKVTSKNISNQIDTLKQFFESIPTPFQLAVETTYNWYYFVDLAERYAETVYLADAYALKSFAKRHKKNDKIDANLIATVLYQGFLPAVTIPDKATREIREFLRYRMKLVQDRSRHIFRLKALLDKLGYQAHGNYTAYRTLSKIDVGGLPQLYQKTALGYRDAIKALSEKLTQLNKEMKTLCEQNPEMIRLLTIPGIGYFSAALIHSEIIDIRRFSSFGRLCAYAGLAPRVIASADHLRYGSLNKNCRKHLKWILLENVIHFIKANPRAKLKYQKLKQRKGHNTAKVASAREMLRVVFRVLKEKRSYYEESFQSVGVTALARG